MDGLGEPMKDVDVLIARGNRIIYDHLKERVKLPGDNGAGFYMDDYLEITDVTHDGVPEVLFHSGNRGASDSITLEHILLYNKSKASFADVAPASFYGSGTHGLRWLTSGTRKFAVIADRNWPPTTPLEDRCHYCSSPFEYDTYQWSNSKAAFDIYRHLYGEKSYSDANEALDGDWTLIQSALSH